jgi:TetR/AcrR family transcriptional regulator
MKNTGRRERKLEALAGSVRARRAQRIREQILRAGLKVFSSKGFERATMDDIALELEATKGLLYYHFKTKEEILSAILKQSPVIAALESGLRALDPLPFATAVRAAVHGSIGILEAHRDFIRFLHIQALLSGEEAEVVYNEVIERLRQSVAAGIEKFKATGEVKADADSTHWSNMMVSLVISYFLQNQVFGQSHKLGTDYLDYMIETLISAIGTGANAAGREGSK